MLGSVRRTLERSHIVNDRQSARSLMLLALTISLVAVGALCVLSGFFSHCNTANIISTTASVLSNTTTSAAYAINTTASTLLSNVSSAIDTVNLTTSSLINSTNILNATTSTVSSLNSTLLSTIYSSISALNQTTSSILNSSNISTALSSTMSALLNATSTTVSTINQTINTPTTVTSAISSLTSALVSLAESAATVLSSTTSTILNATASEAINATAASTIRVKRSISQISSAITSCCSIVYIPMLVCAFVIISALILTYITIQNYKKQKMLMRVGHKRITIPTISKASYITLSVILIALCVACAVMLLYKYMACLLQTMCISTLIGICTIQVALIAIVIMSVLLIFSTKTVTITEELDDNEIEDFLKRVVPSGNKEGSEVDVELTQFIRRHSSKREGCDWSSGKTTLNSNGLPVTPV